MPTYPIYLIVDLNKNKANKEFILHCFEEEETAEIVFKKMTENNCDPESYFRILKIEVSEARPSQIGRYFNDQKRAKALAKLDADDIKILGIEV